MNNDKINVILSDLRKWIEPYQSNKNLNDFCNEMGIHLELTDKLDILLELSKDKEDIFSNLFLLGNSLEEVATDNEKFLELLSNVLEKIKNDLAQGPFVNPLITIGEKNPEMGITLAKKMAEKDGTIALYAGYPLGGAGIVFPNKVLPYIVNLSESSNPRLKSSAILAIRLIYAGKKIDREIFQILQKSFDSEDPIVKGQSLEALLDFYDSDVDYCKKSIMKLVEQNDNLRYALSSRLWIRPISNEEHTLEMLQLCAKSSNKQIKNQIFYALTRLVGKFPEEILEIIRLELEGGGNTFGSIEELIRDLGKTNMDKSLKVLEKWINSNNEILKFHLTHVITLLIPQEKREDFIQYIETWLKKYPSQYNKILEILNSILSECHRTNSNPEFVEKSLNLLIELSKSKGIDPNKFTKTESSQILKCSNLIHALRYYVKDLDYSTIISNVKYFPHIEKMIGIDGWITKMQKENNKMHLLLRILERQFPQLDKLVEIITDINKSKDEREKEWNTFRFGSHVYDALYLLNLDINLQKLENEKIDVIAHFKKKLKNDEQTSDTISEINFLSSFVDKYRVIPEPTFGTKKIDGMIEIDGEQVIVEITNLDMYKPLQLLNGVFTDIPNRMKSKILEKYESQLYALSDIKQPIILAIDTYGTEADDYSFNDAIFGSLQYNFLLDQKGETPDVTYSRQKDSIHDLQPGTDIISAIIYFKSELHTDLKFHIKGKLIHNPHATNPLIDHIARKIEETLFS